MNFRYCRLQIFLIIIQEKCFLIICKFVNYLILQNSFQGVLRRNRVHMASTERDSVTENYRSATSSCSSSDISDYMESLSFISRSSSSSSGSASSNDYVRAEDLYLLRTLPKPPPKTFVPSNCISVPSVHQSRNFGMEMNGVSNHRNNDDSSSVGTSSSSSYQDKSSYSVKDELKLRPNPNSNRDSRSSTSSTSSLSTSPSVTDYSSSTSSSPPCQSNITTRQAFSKCSDSKPEDTNSAQQNRFVYPGSKDEPRKT